MDMQKVLFALIRAGVFGTPVEEAVKNDLCNEALLQVYALCEPQAMSGIVGQALADMGILGADTISQKFRSDAMMALYSYERQKKEFQRICGCLEREKIAYIPLKGAVLRQYYPRPWMRTSSDIDILIKEDDLNCAVDVLKTELGYTQPYARSYHDISLFSKNGVHLELHFSLNENDERLDKVLSTVWQHALPTESGACRHVLTPEFLVYHVTAHAAYHFINSGCGARVLLDLWMLKHKMGFDEETVKQLCAASRIEVFYDAAMQLAEVWYAGGQSNSFLDDLSSHILDAGFCRSREDAVAVGMLKKGGRVKYILSRLWLPYPVLRECYPVVEKKKWMIPFCQAHRWRDALVRRRLGSAAKELKASGDIDTVKMEQTKQLFVQLGLI